MDSASETSDYEIFLEPPAIGVSSNISSSVVIVHNNTDTSDGVRLKQNEKRRLKRDRPKIIDEESPCHSQAGSEPKGSKASGKKRKLPPKAPSQGNSFKFISIQQLVICFYIIGLDAATESDANVGKTVYIDTYGARGKKYGWCEAIIMKKTEEGYTARYVTDKKTTLIPNINDEKFVRFFPCEEQEA